MERNVSRRGILKGAAGAATAAAVVGGKRSSVFAAPTLIRQTGSNVPITFWYGLTGQLGEQIQALVADFNALGNGIEITAVQQADYDETAQQLTLALQDGSFPDVALLSEIWWFRFYLASALLPLNDLIAARNIDTADIVESLFVEGRRQDVQYWMSVARSTPLFYYNVAMFEKAGLSAAPATWSELAEVAPSLVGDGGQVPAFTHPSQASALPWGFQGVVWAYGGRYSDPDFTIRIDEPEAVAAGELFRASVADGWATTSENPGEDLTNNLTAACINSTGGLRAITSAAEERGIEIRTAFLPGERPDAEATVCTGGSGLAIMSGAPTERQEAAFSFIEYWTSPEMTVRWSQGTGYMPIRTSAIESPEMQAFFAENPNFRTAVDQLPRTRPQDTARVFIPGGNQIIGSGMEQIVTAGDEVQGVFDEVAASLTEEAAVIVEQVRALEGEGTPVAARRRVG